VFDWLAEEFDKRASEVSARMPSYTGNVKLVKMTLSTLYAPWLKDDLHSNGTQTA